jgi:6-phosphogluconolactonase (cycloisomerase 2 family)
MTNTVGNNQIFVYHRGDDGKLTTQQTIATGGGGSGVQLSPPDSLGSLGALVLDEDHHRLFAVNTESIAANTQDCQPGTITSFLVAGNGQLTFADRVTSGGLFPNSLTIQGDLLYVLNAGGPGPHAVCNTGPNITGFTVAADGKMKFLAGSVQPINPGPTDGTGSGVNCPTTPGFSSPTFDCGRNPPAFPRSPGQVGFTPDGDQLVVTVKGTNSIYVFPVGKNSTVDSPTVTQAPGPELPTYFGFAFDEKEHMLLTEPFASSTIIPEMNTGAVSSFAIKPNGSKAGTLRQISASIGDQGTAACWIALDPTSQYAYVSNNLSNTISTYSVGRSGSLTLLAATAATGAGPNDLAVVGQDNAAFLYVLDAGDGTVGAFQINLRDGSLAALPAVDGPPFPSSGAAGLAAY